MYLDDMISSFPAVESRGYLHHCGMMKMTTTSVSNLSMGRNAVETDTLSASQSLQNGQHDSIFIGASDVKPPRCLSWCEKFALDEVTEETGITAVTQLPISDTAATLRISTSSPGVLNGRSRPARSLWWQLRWWSLEILSILSAIFCLVSIAVVLRAFNAKPQSSWPSDALTLNGLVALLATTCRTSFMIAVGAGLAQGKWQYLQTRAGGDNGYQLGLLSLFGEAAKGPWGSTQLLWRFKGLHVSCLGAAVTILSLAFGLFSQQLIGLRTITVKSTSLGAPGQVPRLSHLKDEHYNETGEPPPFIKMAIYNGLTSFTIESPRVNCPSGNCTWPVIPTLGVCGACIDVTETIEFQKRSEHDCASITGNVRIEGPCSPEGRSEEDEWPAFVSGAGSGEVFSAGQGPSDESAGNVIATFTGIGFAKGQVPLDNLSNFLSRAQARECALWYCVQAHEIAVVGRELHDEVIDTWHKARKIDGGFVFDDVPAEFNVEPQDVYEGRSSLINNIPSWFSLTTEGAVWEYDDFFSVTDTSNYTGGDFIDPFGRTLTTWIRGSIEWLPV